MGAGGKSLLLGLLGGDTNQSLALAWDRETLTTQEGRALRSNIAASLQNLALTLADRSTCHEKPLS